MVSWSELYITVHKALNTTVKLLPFLSFAKKDPPLQLINLIHPTSISLSIFFFFTALPTFQSSLYSQHVPPSMCSSGLTCYIILYVLPPCHLLMYGPLYLGSSWGDLHQLSASVSHNTSIQYAMKR